MNKGDKVEVTKKVSIGFFAVLPGVTGTIVDFSESKTNALVKPDSKLVDTVGYWVPVSSLVKIDDAYTFEDFAKEIKARYDHAYRMMLKSEDGSKEEAHWNAKTMAYTNVLHEVGKLSV